MSRTSVHPLHMGCALALALTATMACADEGTADDTIWTRGTLTADWAGARSELRADGVSISMDTTHYYQGLASGCRGDDFNYGGRADAFINLDTGNLVGGKAAACTPTLNTVLATCRHSAAKHFGRSTPR